MLRIVDRSYDKINICNLTKLILSSLTSYDLLFFIIPLQYFKCDCSKVTFNIQKDVDAVIATIITYEFCDLQGSTPLLVLHQCRRNLELHEEFDKIEHPLQSEIDLGYLHHLDLVVHERLSFLQKVH